MQDLVGIGIADSREEPRIGEGALDGVILAAQPLRELLLRRYQDLEPATVELGEIASHMQRCPTLRPCFGQAQGTGTEDKTR